MNRELPIIILCAAMSTFLGPNPKCTVNPSALLLTTVYLLWQQQQYGICNMFPFRKLPSAIGCYLISIAFRCLSLAHQYITMVLIIKYLFEWSSRVLFSSDVNSPIILYDRNKWNSKRCVGSYLYFSLTDVTIITTI